MSQRRIRTTHVGSLVRPPELLAARDDAALLRRSVAEVVRRQVETGLDIVDDGEYGKIGFIAYVTERLGGLHARKATTASTYTKGLDRQRFAEFYAEYDADVGNTRTEWAVVEPLAYRGTAQLQRDLGLLRDALQNVGPHEAFVPAVAPGSVEPYLVDEHYGSPEALLEGVANALRDEYRAIVDAGFILQVDDAWIPAMFDRMVPPATLEDYRRWATLRIDALNHALAGLPPERTRYHICWGSWNGPHTTDVPLADVVDIILRVNVGAYLIESANPRHEHEWRVWENVDFPDDRVLIPGVVSHCTNVVEHPDLVAERLLRFAGILGPERVIGGTDCGFAQVAGYRRVHPQIMWAKLEALVEGARRASAAI